MKRALGSSRFRAPGPSPLPTISPQRFALAGGRELSVASFEAGPSVLIVEDARAPVVAYQTWVHAGSASEDADQAGVAHMLEHMMFLETRSLGPGELDRRFETLGADVNAATWFDWTQYTVSLPSASLDAAMELEAERLRELVVRQDLLERERDVVKNERQSRVDDDIEGALSEALWQEAFPGHPYGRPILGTHQDIERISLAVCRRFYEQYYRPAAVSLVVVGDVRAEQLLAQVEHHYGPGLGRCTGGFGASREPSLHPASQAASPLGRPAQGVVSVEGWTETAKLTVGYRIPSLSHPDGVALWALSELLAGGSASLLQQRLVVEQEVASDVSASATLMRHGGLFEVSLSGRPGVAPEELVEAWNAIAGDLQHSGIGSEELRRAVSRLELSEALSTTTLGGLAGVLGYYAVLTGDPLTGYGRLQELAALTSERLTEVSRAMLAKGWSVAVVARPRGARSPSLPSRGSGEA